MKKIIFTAFTIILIIPNYISAQSVSENRSYSRSLAVDENFRFEIDNRYGDIHFFTWSKDSVAIRAEVEGTASSSSKLRNMLEGIEIDISESSSTVRAETKFNKEITVLFESFKGFTDKIIDYGSRIRINYFISVPGYLDLHIKNQFGDVIIEENTGVITLDLANGDFTANSLNRLKELNFDFGEAKIGAVTSARITTTFSKFYINDVGELSVSSTGSRYELGKVGKFDFESRRDKFFIGVISELKGTSYFSDFKIDNLNGDIDTDLKYGNFEAENIKSAFKKISVTSAYADVLLKFDPSVSFSYEINALNAFVVTPVNNSRSEQKTINEEKKEYLISGTAGSGPGAHEVKIDAHRGNISLKN